MGPHQPHDLAAAVGLDIELTANVGQRRQQRRRRLVAEDAGKRRIRREVAAVLGRLEHAPDGVVEHAARQLRPVRIAVIDIGGRYDGKPAHAPGQWR
jgi:hypothetical protein